MPKQKMTALSLIESGAVKIVKEQGRTYKNDATAIPSRARNDPLFRSLLNFDKPPKWLAPVCVVGMSEKEQARELDKQIARLKSHGVLSWRTTEQMVYCERELIEQ